MSDSKKSNAGRPRKDLKEQEFSGWDQLDALIIWASEEYCAEKLNISVSTLQRRLRERGYNFDQYKYKRRETLRINLMKKQYEVAMAGDRTMLVWLGKNELGQSDKLESQVSNTDTVNITYVKDED